MGYRIEPKSLCLPLIAGTLSAYLLDNFALGAAVFVLLIFPKMVTLYVRYARNNPKQYWFKRKLYGWGWTPVTWQGWVVVLAFLSAVLLNYLRLDMLAHVTLSEYRAFLIETLVMLLGLMVICYRTGERPRWQWGRDSDEE